MIKSSRFLLPLEESADCALLSSFCDDSDWHISMFEPVVK